MKKAGTIVYSTKNTMQMVDIAARPSDSKDRFCTLMKRQTMTTMYDSFTKVMLAVQKRKRKIFWCIFSTHSLLCLQQEKERSTTNKTA